MASGYAGCPRDQPVRAKRKGSQPDPEQEQVERHRRTGAELLMVAHSPATHVETYVDKFPQKVVRFNRM